MTNDETRIAAASESIPLMQETYRQLVTILEKHLGAPMTPKKLNKLRLTLSLNSGDLILFLVGYSEDPPKDMEKLEK